jgi:hypothetical protein
MIILVGSVKMAGQNNVSHGNMSIAQPRTLHFTNHSGVSDEILRILLYLLSIPEIIDAKQKLSGGEFDVKTDAVESKSIELPHAVKLGGRVPIEFHLHRLNFSLLAA